MKQNETKWIFSWLYFLIHQFLDRNYFRKNINNDAVLYYLNIYNVSILYRNIDCVYLVYQNFIILLEFIKRNNFKLNTQTYLLWNNVKGYKKYALICFHVDVGILAKKKKLSNFHFENMPHCMLFRQDKTQPIVMYINITCFWRILKLHEDN